MLFHSSFRRELARNFGGTCVVLLTIVGTMMLIRTLSAAAKGVIDSSDLALLLGYTMLGYVPIILTLSLFVSIVATLSRMYRDHEMDIWLSAGKGLFGFLGPLYRFAWPVLLVIGVAALGLWPWSNQQMSDLKERFEKRGDIERVAPGQFQESASGERVFFIDKEQPDGKTGKNIFISTQDAAKESVTSARDGRVDELDGDRYIMLNNGQRLEVDKATQALRVSEFTEYGSRMKDGAQIDTRQPSPRQTTTPVLLAARTPPMLGEFSWRLGLVLTAFNLVVLALAVSTVNPRASRSANLIFALFAFVVYYNLVNLGQAWIAGGKVKWVPFMVLLHGGACVFSLVWLLKRHTGFSVKSTVLRAFAKKRLVKA